MSAQNRSRVTVGGNWSYEDQLGGTTLSDGEAVRVRWPDGSASTHIVKVLRSSQTISDMGHPAEIPIIRAFITIEHRGALVRVRLAGLNADVSRGVS